MNIGASVQIDATREKVWRLVTDFDNWADTISGILSVEVIDQPPAGIVGLKWREERMMFGKNAFETMWISAAESGHWYETTAENHGAIYTTRVSVDDSNGKTELTMQFSARPVSIAAKAMSLMSFMFNGTIRKMLQQDLEDVRQAAEKS
jgi:carbon monoxide dehydrogenase subunit G